MNVEHPTIYRWVQHYAPQIDKKFQWYWDNSTGTGAWHLDETYIKTNGTWAYLHRGADSKRGYAGFLSLTASGLPFSK